MTPHAGAAASVLRVRFEHRDDPSGLGTATPRLSWQTVTDDPGWVQTAYEVELDGQSVARVRSSDQVLVPWPFQPLSSRSRAAVRVRAACGDTWSSWSEPATAEIGLLSAQDWSGRFVTPRHIGRIGQPAPLITRTVTVRERVVSARLYITAHGLYVATLNGHRVGDEVLAPGWTSYAKRLRYQVYDVTDLARVGQNALEVLLGNGWFRGRLDCNGLRAYYGDRLALLAQLEVTHVDGTTEVIGTDSQWRARPSGVLDDDLYDGQHSDLRRQPLGEDSVDVLDADLDRLVAADGPPMRVTEVVPAMQLWRSRSGRAIVDFGRNLVGWVRVRVRGARDGQQVTVRHAEVLEHGELCTRTLRSAKASDTYVLPDADEVTLQPELTFHGFRYAEITGVEDLDAANVEAVVVGTGLRRAGWFSCSDPEVNRFHANVVASMRGNFLDVPIDCAQRDERFGWTGDVQVFCPTASFLFDTAGFLSSWLSDLAADQLVDGVVPGAIPDPWSCHPPDESRRFTHLASAGWGDAAVIVPWLLHERYGDRGLLARQFSSMCRWVDKVASLTTDGAWVGGFQFGDWLDPSAPPADPGKASADPDVVATAYLARSADLLAEAARTLGRRGEAGRYSALAEATRRAFAREYVSASGRVASDCATVYSMALAWDLLPSPAQRRGAASRLAHLVRASRFRMSTGYLGTPLVVDALTAAGYSDLAYQLLLQRACPSWLYQVTMGATTVWERWDGLRPDGSVNPASMTSFNHCALGAVADWMHRTVAGLAPAAPGYRRIRIQPLPNVAMTHASARHATPYGETAVRWRRHDGLLTVDVLIPVGARASVHLPGSDTITVSHGAYSWTVPDPAMKQG